MKIVINSCYGGYKLSDEAHVLLRQLGHTNPEDLPRNHVDLISVVENLGVRKSSGAYTKLEIVEVPDEIEFFIDDYDGDEQIIEQGHVWP